MSNHHKPQSPSGEILEALFEAFTYDVETGEVRHNLDRPRSHFSSERMYNKWKTRATNQPVVGTVDGSGYATIMFTHPLLKKRKTFKAHHLAWLLYHKEWPTNCLDHMNGDRADNRIANLRAVSHRQNNHNKSNQSELGVGVRANGKNFQARIKILGITYHIGLYNTTTIAAAAFDCVTLSFFDDTNVGPNGLSWNDLEETISKIDGLAEKIEDIRNKLAEKLTNEQQYKETV